MSVPQMVDTWFLLSVAEYTCGRGSRLSLLLSSAHGFDVQCILVLPPSILVDQAGRVV